jgi:hypothetical protein
MANHINRGNEMGNMSIMAKIILAIKVAPTGHHSLVNDHQNYPFKNYQQCEKGLFVVTKFTCNLHFTHVGHQNVQE